MENLQIYHDFAVEVIKKSGNLLLDKSNDFKKIYKGPHDLVTNLDYFIQDFIINQLSKNFPNHGYLAEEETHFSSKPNSITWIIDPIDGSINFSNNIPFFCITVSLVMNNEPKIGVTYDPIRNEIFSAIKDNGCFYNGLKRYTKSIKKKLNKSTIGFDWEITEGREKDDIFLLEKLRELSFNVNIFGSAALSLAWLSIGRIDGYIKNRIEPWDFIAGSLMVKETGGVVTDFSNNKKNIKDNLDKSIIASNGNIHNEIIDLIQSTRKKTSAIIMLGGEGKRLRPYTKNTPKSLLNIPSKCIFESQLSVFKRCGINKIITITGFFQEKYLKKIDKYLQKNPGIEIKNIYNPFFRTTNNLVATWFGIINLGENEEAILVNGDDLFKPRIIINLLNSKKNNKHIIMVVSRKQSYDQDDMKVIIDDLNSIEKISKDIDIREANGEAIGINLFDSVGVKIIEETLKSIMKNDQNHNLSYVEIIQHVIEKGIPIGISYCDPDDWIEMDTIADYKKIIKIHNQNPKYFIEQ